MDANESAGWSCSTKKCLMPACCCLAKMRFQSIVPAPTSAILLSGGPIESFTCTIENRPGQRAKYVRGSWPGRFSMVHVKDSIDRKSTRLNSSHDQISYAVFCLKKKK